MKCWLELLRVPLRLVAHVTPALVIPAHANRFEGNSLDGKMDDESIPLAF